MSGESRHRRASLRNSSIQFPMVNLLSQKICYFLHDIKIWGERESFKAVKRKGTKSLSTSHRETTIIYIYLLYSHGNRHSRGITILPFYRWEN